jgi:outer membrane protein OmpA-like peptidoglycan-associated protein
MHPIFYVRTFFPALLSLLGVWTAVIPSSTAVAVELNPKTAAVAAKQLPVLAVPQGTKPISDVSDFLPDGVCPDPGPAASAMIAKAAVARIPLKVGLTLSHTWKAQTGDYEHECLTQVESIDSRGFVVKGSCPIGPKREIKRWSRRICWSDFANSYLYLTGNDEAYPQTFGGALQFSLSQSSFTSLKTRGEFRHRYLGLYDPDPRFVETDIDGTEKSEGGGTFNLIINDKLVEVPTIETVSFRQPEAEIIRLKVLDEPAFPLVLDYYIPTEKKFFITYTKVSFPQLGDLEQHLAIEKKTDVYGIYFDFAKSTLRSESQPVLQEIAAAMKAHPEWQLVIAGHTDNIGIAAENLELSQQRAQTVRKALVEQFMIDATRLSTDGFGASQPKESNDTERGRARNRRVELVRK